MDDCGSGVDNSLLLFARDMPGNKLVCGEL